MIIDNVPFFPNTPDDTHCLQAVLKMILKHFQPNKVFTFGELDKLSDKVPGKWTWATRALINFHRMGFELVNIESFDYLDFSNNGEKYLDKKFGPQVAQTQSTNSNIIKEMIDAKEYIEIFGSSFVLPEILDIKSFVDQEFLVGCNLNAEKLNHNPGYTGHFVLIYGYDSKNIYLHDPGSPPYPNRQVSYADFTSAWGYPNHTNQNLTAFRYNKP